MFKVVHQAFLFGDFQITKAISGRSDYEHTFGGPPDRKGAFREDCGGIHLHLLHRFDLTDPLVPVSIPGLRWLPLYYCFDFRVNEFGYRLVSDKKMVTYFFEEENVSDDESWPDDDYPMEFPHSRIKLTKQKYDPTKFNDAMSWSGVFGISKLSEKNQSKARKMLLEHLNEYDLPIPETEQELDLLFNSPYAQDRPITLCPNPKCSNRRKEHSLVSLAIMRGVPVKGVHIFGEYGDFVQLIFMICPKCHTIRVSNQCD